MTIDKITSYIGYRKSFLWVIDYSLLKWMFDGDSAVSLNTLWMLQKCSLSLFVAGYVFLIMFPALSWMSFVAELDLRPVSLCIPAHSFKRSITLWFIDVRTLYYKIHASCRFSLFSLTLGKRTKAPIQTGCHGNEFI